MGGNYSNLTGVEPILRDYIDTMGDWASDQTVVVVMPANPTPAPTSAVGSFIVPFELRSERTGKVIPINGPVAATITQSTSGGGTAAVSTATPQLSLGRGSVTVTHTTGTWANADTISLTLTYTNLRGSTDVDTFVATFTTP